jgi:hypothetical protein
MILVLEVKEMMFVIVVQNLEIFYQLEQIKKKKMKYLKNGKNT